MEKTAAARDVWSDMITTLTIAFPVISSLEAGLREDCTRLIEFEAELSRTLEDSHELANVCGSPGDWNTGCHHHWDHVAAVLRRIHRLVGELCVAVENSQPQSAWKLWEELQHQESRLAIALSGLHDESTHLNEAAAMDWNKLVLTIESHRKAVQAGIQGLRIRLQSWAAHSLPDEDAAQIPFAIPEPDAPRPDAGGMNPETYSREFDEAALEIEAEQHQPMGIIDGVKALFMWVESPGERVRKKHSAA